MADPQISALLPVHAGVAPPDLHACLDSLTKQTRRADEVVIVEDGPLTSAHIELLDGFALEHSDVVRVRLARNGGAGVANQAGLKVARGTWIAKVDADDINVPSRFARQFDVVSGRAVDVCGAAMGEFAESPDTLVGVRTSPLAHAEILQRMRWNNPVNHPTSFYRRDLALEVGGYPSMRFMQDYDLFARMAAAGALFLNLPDVLVLFRAEPAMYRRRRSAEIHRLEWKLQGRLRTYGLIGRPRQALNVVARTGARLLPAALMARVHRRLFLERRGSRP